MTTENSELKTSDEILEELFGMCQKRQLQSSDESSQSTDCENEDNASKKRKKKKKKRRKSKKHRHNSVESVTEEDKSYKRKKKKNKSHDSDEEKKVKLKHKIKQESEHILFKEIKTSNKNENENLMDTTTGKTLTIDDVFNSFSIVPAESKIEVKPFDLADVKIKKENGYDNINEEKPIQEPDSDQKSVPKNDMNEKDRTLTLNEVFEGPAEAEGDRDKSKAGKISIKDLKNSCVYEATIKEVEEQERLKAEKYEEGEISSSSSSSNEGVSDSPYEENESHTVKEKHYRKHKHRLKNHEYSKHHSRILRKHSHEKNFHKSSRHRGSSSPYRSVKRNYSDYHYYETSRRSHHSRHSRRDSEESHGSSKSESRKFRSKREKSERSRSKTRSGVHSKEKKSRSKSTEKIDKQKLLEIARKNAISLLKQGALPASVIVNKDKITSIKAGGKTVDELTDFCKQLSKKDAEGQESISSDSDLESNEDRDKAFHHPFQLKERPSSIVMNIRNAVSLPTKTAQEKTLQLSKQLSLQYPVSSGHQHRTNESEWVPVEKPSAPAAPSVAPVTVAPVTVMAPVEPYYTLNTPVNPPLPNYPPIDYNSGYSNSIVPPPSPNVDIGSIVAQRLEAIRRLSENPQDPIGNNLIRAADSKMKVWAESKVQPGLFTGSTGVKPLTTAELSSGFKAWAKKSQFVAAKPVSSDKGEALMKKMGWQPGEGLGKYKQGPPEPCEINMKTDRKGLAEQSISFQQNNVGKKLFEMNQNKHPVSLLNEYCSRKKIGVPQYDCEEKEGVGRRKLFLFSVSVQGNKFTPKSPCCNKKQSKIEAATLCLQALGILPVVTTA